MSRDTDGDSPVRRTKRTGKGAVPFSVTDEIGKVAVDPDGATFSIRRHLEEKDRSLRYTTHKYEGRIYSGDTVHVYGPKQESADGEGAPGNEHFYVGDDADVTITYKISDTTADRTALRSLVRGGVYTLFFVGFFILVAFTVIEESSGMF